MSFVNDTIVATTSAVALRLVFVGGIYYALPSWRALPDQATVEDTLSQYATAPINVAAGIGSRLGGSVMKAAGYTFTASELQELRPKLFAQAAIPNTPENAAQKLYEIMQRPGSIEQLKRERINVLGTANSDWNAAVAAAFYPMYRNRLEDAMHSYMFTQ